jgi:hypothetical protein
MNEAHFAEIEKVLLFISDARERAAKAASTLEGDQAELHLLSALREAEEDLASLHRSLMQRTYFAVTAAQLPL